MRRASKIDDNQPELVKFLEYHGAKVDKVSSLAGLGYDLVVGYLDQIRLVEVKDGAKPPSQRKLTESEHKAQAKWGDKYVVVINQSDCLVMLSEMRGVRL